MHAHLAVMLIGGLTVGTHASVYSNECHQRSKTLLAFRGCRARVREQNKVHLCFCAEQFGI